MTTRQWLVTVRLPWTAPAPRLWTARVSTQEMNALVWRYVSPPGTATTAGVRLAIDLLPEDPHDATLAETYAALDV